MSTLYYESSIAHHGVKGQKWGVRRYQNPDGSLNAAGKRHVAEWKEDQLSRIYPKYRKEAREAEVNRKAVKLVEARHSGNQKKIDKAEAKLTKAEAKYFLDQGLRGYEEAKVKKMTLDDIDRENNKVKLNVAKSVGITLGTLGLSAVTGFPVSLISIPMTENVRTNSRISKEEREAIKAISDEKANRSHLDRIKKRG